MSNSAISVGIYPAAAKADMVAASSNVLMVTPGVTQYHPGVGKAFCRWTTVTTTAITSSYNVASLTDNGTGDTTINFTTAFSDANYLAICSVPSSGATATQFFPFSRNNAGSYANSTPTTSAARFVVSAGAIVDLPDQMAIFFGSQ